MTKLLFVDHVLHRATASSAFFADLLKSRFEVAHLYVRPEGQHAFDWQMIADHDIIVLWQMDYLAPLFLARGHRTVVVPMYDASAALPQIHWACAGGARFVNFSRTLHERVRLLGLDSLSVKYFVPPAAEDALPRFDTLRVFLWQRQPEQGISHDMVARLFGDQMTSLHVHNAPDNPVMAARFRPPTQLGERRVTVTDWFADRADYLRVLRSCNVFVCPRPAEGIGMAMLEALADGMLVAANDLPSHNEYICNWLNGVLFNASNVGGADFSDVARIARLGWRTARDGYTRWQACIPAILAFIEATPRHRPLASNVTTWLQRELLPAYVAGGEIYERFLLKLLPAMLRLETRSDPQAEPVAAPRHHARADRAALPVTVLPTRTEDGATVAVLFAEGAARPLLYDGWSGDETFGVWIDGVQARLRFAAAIDFPVAALALNIRALSPGDAGDHTNLSVTINDVASSRPVAVLGGEARQIRCQIALPSPLTTRSWQIEFSCDRVLGATGDSRRLSVALMALTIEFLPTPPPEEPAVAAVAKTSLEVLTAPLPPLPARARAGGRDKRVAPGEAAAAALDAVVRKANRRDKTDFDTRLRPRAEHVEATGERNLVVGHEDM